MFVIFHCIVLLDRTQIVHINMISTYAGFIVIRMRNICPCYKYII